MLINGYTNLLLANPACHPGSVVYSARFELGVDVSHLFPYINAEIENTQYYERPQCVLFELAGFKVSLYPDSATAAPFGDRELAIGAVDELIDFLNDLDRRKVELVPDHTYFTRPRSVLKVLKALPRTNCGECGYSTCMAFATAVCQNEALPEQCPEFRPDV